VTDPLLWLGSRSSNRILLLVATSPGCLSGDKERRRRRRRRRRDAECTHVHTKCEEEDKEALFLKLEEEEECMYSSSSSSSSFFCNVFKSITRWQSRVQYNSEEERYYSVIFCLLCFVFSCLRSTERRDNSYAIAGLRTNSHPTTNQSVLVVMTSKAW
jgi:hypothetical protein